MFFNLRRSLAAFAHSCSAALLVHLAFSFCLSTPQMKLTVSIDPAICGLRKISVNAGFFFFFFFFSRKMSRKRRIFSIKKSRGNTCNTKSHKSRQTCCVQMYI